MEAETMLSADVQVSESDETSDSFLCCICLELLYKPVVLACGHISCFWCVHKSMNGIRESLCPICRRPYLHFPSICWMLHCLLVKMYPDAYKRREIQISEEEKRISVLSPRIGYLMHQETEETKVDSPFESCTTRDEYGLSPHAAASRNLAIQEENAPKIKLNETSKKVSISDVMCVSCKELLFRPVVLNCGHVYCESCLTIPENERLKCQECESIHPGEPPNVCLELDHFLEEKFSDEYAKKRYASRQKEKNSACESSRPDARVTHKDGEPKSLWSGSVHLRVGCDYCGMFPITGDRYRCQDCIEEIGFDLCGDCYNSQSKLPGRFNQQHRPEHKFECMRVNPQHNFVLRLMSGILARSETPNAPSPEETILNTPTDVPEVSELELSLPFQFQADSEEDLSDSGRN